MLTKYDNYIWRLVRYQWISHPELYEVLKLPQCTIRTCLFEVLYKVFLWCASVDTCSQPVIRGPCRGSFERWYFDKQRDSCSLFVYGGCKGNDNRFGSREDCENRCKESIINGTYFPCERNNMLWLILIVLLIVFRF